STRTGYARCPTTNVHVTLLLFFFSIAPAPTATHTLSLHDALPISTADYLARSPARLPGGMAGRRRARATFGQARPAYRCSRPARSEEHTSELQSLRHLVCRLLLEKKKKTKHKTHSQNTDDNSSRQT